MRSKILDLIIKSPYATGIDISKYDLRFDIDAPLTKEYTVAELLKALDFAMLRLGGGFQSGAIALDDKFKDHWKELEQHKEIIRGLYWYFSSHSSWEKQRDFIFKELDKLDGHWEWFSVDFERYFNVKTAGFALSCIRLAKALQRRYPIKKILIYSNYYVYKDWLRFYTAEADDFPYHHAQYPWSSWKNLTTYFMGWWRGIFENMTRKPSLPKTRNGSWELWQLGEHTFIGKLIGLGREVADFNISRRKKPDFIKWLGEPARWNNDAPAPPQIDNREKHLNEAIKAIESIK